MRVYVALISSSVDLNREFVHVGESLIPKEIRQRFGKGCSYLFDAFDPLRLGAGFTVDQHILKRCRGCDYIVALIEEGAGAFCQNIRYAVLNATIDLNQVDGTSFGNFFSSRLAKLFKAVIFTRDKMASTLVEQAMRLPIRNFRAPELEELCRVYRDNLFEASFHNDAKRLIDMLGARRHPRRRSSYPIKYFVDDGDKYFVFGNELHESLPTGSPHQPRCELNGRFRFGRSISINHHFNVSQGDANQTYISGQFPNCHDAIVTTEKGRTHLNMFSNDHC